VSVTVDRDLWDEVRSLVDADDAVETASSAVEEGLSLWVANHRLGRALDALYEEDPAARPSDGRFGAPLRLWVCDSARARLGGIVGVG
jgi:hypothetical protein